MAGDGAIFLGRMTEAMPATLIIFAVTYMAAKSTLKLRNTNGRILALCFEAFLVVGLIHAIFYESFTTGFGQGLEPSAAQVLGTIALLGLCLVVSIIVIVTGGRRRGADDQGS